MSFSSEIKEELLRVTSSARHCQLAELSALSQLGSVGMSQVVEFEGEDDESTEHLQKEKAIAAKKYDYLCKKVSQNIKEQISFQLAPNSILLKNSCCKRAFLRGAFLATGSMSDPNKGYHLELVCDEQSQAELLVKLLHDFDLDAKTVLRKRYHVVYLKEGENISDFLNVVEAHKALLDFENTRVLKDMRNLINRRVNCEAANINKTVNAATRQVESIRLIEEKIGLSSLPDNLRQMAYVRLENPDAPLLELGELLEPKVGKSGVNHRLRKICEIAEELR